MRNALVGTLVLALISCSKETDSSKKDVPPPGGESRVVVLKVDGMQRGEGGKT